MLRPEPDLFGSWLGNQCIFGIELASPSPQFAESDNALIAAVADGNAPVLATRTTARGV